MHPQTRALHPTAFGTSGLWRALRPRDLFEPARRLVPWFAVIAVVLALAGLHLGLIVAPPAQDQGDAFRIVFIHVPAAWMSLAIFVVMAALSAATLAMRHRLAPILASALAPTGATFAFVTLWTGALWGRPTWGSWWAWDARLTSALLLFLFYLTIIATQMAIEDIRRADRSTAILSLVGVVNVPIVYFSVQWWNTLHQSTGIALNVPAASTAIAIAGTGLLTLACIAYAAAATLLRAQSTILERERRSPWATHLRDSDALE